MIYLTRGRANASLSPDGGRGLALGAPIDIVPPIITRTAAAVIGPYTAGQRPIDAYTPGTYASTAGTIIRTASWRVNGSVVAGTVTLIGAQTVELVESVTDSAGTPARVFGYGPVAVPAIAPQVNLAIDQGSIDAGDVLGTDITATATIVSAGSPALLAGSIAITWLVDGAPRAAGQSVTFAEVVRAVASWAHPAGAGSVHSVMRTVPAARAPQIAVSLAQAAYSAGQTVNASDIQITITDAGHPALDPQTIVRTLRVNGTPAALPYTAVAGHVVVGRAAALHVTGAILADSTPVTVGAPPAMLPALFRDATVEWEIAARSDTTLGPLGLVVEVSGVPYQITVSPEDQGSVIPVPVFPRLLRGTGTGWEIRPESNDLLGALTLLVTRDGVPQPSITLTAAQQISGEPINHVLPAIAHGDVSGSLALVFPGLWTHGLDPEPLPLVQWRRNGAAISGATEAVYVKGPADAGTTITCAVTVAGVVAVSNAIEVASTAGTEGTFLGSVIAQGGAPFALVSPASLVAGQKYVIAISTRSLGGAVDDLTLAVNGTAAQRRQQAAFSDSAQQSALFEVTPTTTGTDLVVGGTGTATSLMRSAHIWSIPNMAMFQRGAASPATAGQMVRDVSLSVVAGELVIAAGGARSLNELMPLTLSGVTQRGPNRHINALIAVGGDAGNVAAATPRSVTLTRGADSGGFTAVAGAWAAPAAPVYADWPGPIWYSADGPLALSGAVVQGIGNRRPGQGDLTAAGTAAANITRVENAQNGLPAIRLVRDVSSSAAVPHFHAAAADAASTMWRGEDRPFTVLVAYRPTDANSGFIFSGGEDTGGQVDQTALVRRASPSSTIRKSQFGSHLDVNFGAGQAANIPRIVAIRHTGTAVTIWDTSTTAILTNVGHNSPTSPDANTRFRLFAAFNVGSGLATTQCAMDFYEIVCANSALPQADIQAGIAAMAEKWGIPL